MNFLLLFFGNSLKNCIMGSESMKFKVKFVCRIKNFCFRFKMKVKNELLIIWSKLIPVGKDSLNFSGPPLAAPEYATRGEG